MHEVSIAENVIQIVERVAQEHQLGRIEKVVLEIGQFSGVEADLLRYAFEIIRKGTLIEKAEIEILSPPLLLYCQDCETEYLGELDDLRCPVCLGENFETLQGREMLIKSIIGAP